MKAKIAALALLTSALFTTNASAFTSTTEHIAYCGNGNFYGEVKYKKIVTFYKTTFHAHSYRISRWGNQSGGNKANINIGSQETVYRPDRGYSFLKTQTSNSPDDRKQNGRWHTMDTKFEIHGSPRNIRRAAFFANFIFDKSGKDPKCSALDEHV